MNRVLGFSGSRVLGFSSSLVLGFAGSLLLSVALHAQQRDATGVPKAVVSTAQISGVVVTAEANSQPIRRAVVTLTGGAGNPRSVMTDDAGRFTFAQLAAGTFSVTARKAAYLAAPYGARKPGRAGTPVVLTDGQRATLTINMFRGAAITGVLRDSAGLPVTGVDVRAMDVRTVLTNPDSAFELTTTDDRGVYRLYGLLPGEYVVVALPTVGGRDEIFTPSAAYVDAALAGLTRRSTGNAAAAPTPHISTERAVTFAPVFYPGTSDYAAAMRVQVGPGDERPGVDFELAPLPVAAIEGTVSGDVPNLAAVQVSIIPSGPRVTTGMSSNSLSGRPIDAQGRFRYSNLPPGKYRIVARGHRSQTESPNRSTPGSFSASGGSGGVDTARVTVSTGDYLFGVVDVELRGTDITGVNLVLQPGGVITGRIVFAATGATAKPQDLSKISALLRIDGGGGIVSSGGLMMGNGLVSSPVSTVSPDGTFEIRSIGPGRFNLYFALGSGTDAAGWKLRSALAGDRELLHDVLELGPGTDLRNVAVTFSDAITEISGTLQTSAGQPATDYYIVALPANRALWQPGSRRILSARPSTAGRFVFADPAAGEYLIVALADLDPIDLTDLSFLEQIAPAGVKVTVNEGERKVQDLRIR